MVWHVNISEILLINEVINLLKTFVCAPQTEAGKKINAGAFNLL
jgi:hypothetical protein